MKIIFIAYFILTIYKEHISIKYMIEFYNQYISILSIIIITINNTNKL